MNIAGNASRALVWLVLAAVASSCVATKVRTELQDPSELAGVSVESPFKAFLSDGRIAVFEDGGWISADSVYGTGTLYAADFASTTSIDALAVDALIGLEIIQSNIDWLGTVGVSTLVAAGATYGSALLAAAIFGSCPTVYSYDASEALLEAEAFSYSIAPLLEMRDVDRIGATADSQGVLTLELRNEALETHYINHLELLEVRHGPAQTAYSDEEDRILVVSDVVEASSAVDRDGFDRLAELRARDGEAYHSSDERIQAVTAEDFRDYLEVAFARPPSDSVALVLRLRNSLLNTVLFYDLMLEAQGAEALDWLGVDLASIGETVEMGLWFRKTMGLEVSVWRPDGWERVARLRDTGPLAWDEVAVQLPIPEGDEIHVRMAFLADAWRIDFVGLAQEAAIAAPTKYSFTRVAPFDAAHDPALALKIAQPDEDYLVTGPGRALMLASEPMGAYSAADRTLFLGSQGYYTEWIRPQWIRSPEAIEPFRPTDATIVDLMARWLERKDAFQEQFFQSRIPVR